jgi:hypothetical protein
MENEKTNYKIAAKTTKKVILEVSKNDMNLMGFDEIWDGIREKFSQDKYQLFSIDSIDKEDVIFFELKPIKK